MQIIVNFILFVICLKLKWFYYLKFDLKIFCNETPRSNRCKLMCELIKNDNSLGLVLILDSILQKTSTPKIKGHRTHIIKTNVFQEKPNTYLKI